MFMQSFSQAGDAAPAPLADPYANDIARQLCVTGASSEDLIANLRNMNLGDDFWMYSFKVAPCAKTFSHKWTLCPCAHAGETARRRDPRFHPYRAVLCPLVKVKKACPMGDNCMWSHNVFEHWLHPSRYKTRLCSFGRNCNRPICFFAHSAEDMRSVPVSDEGKEMDESEYVMQLMLAQEAGILPSTRADATAPGQRQPHGLPPVPPQRTSMAGISSRLINMQASNNAGARGGSDTNLILQSRALQQQQQLLRNASQQQQAGMDTASLLLGLQESLANLSMPADAGWHSSAFSGGPQVARISDPGPTHVPPHLMASAAMHPAHRFSDSGQALTLASPHEIAGLESLLNSALAGGAAAPQMQGTAFSPCHTPPTVHSPPVSCSPANSGPLHFVTSSPGSSGPLQFLPASGSPPPASAAPANGAVTDRYVRDLVAQLQEQGIVNSKEQLVESLSQLLAQLLVN